jgi:hypothetical protein
MPPAPSKPTISYEPKCIPGASRIERDYKRDS